MHICTSPLASQKHLHRLLVGTSSGSDSNLNVLRFASSREIAFFMAANSGLYSSRPLIQSPLTPQFWAEL
jgi:hypothetical protein